MKFRNKAARGEIVAAPFNKEHWVYLCFIDGVACYLYRYISKGIITDISLLKQKEWINHLNKWFVFMGKMPTSYCTLGSVELTPEEIRPWHVTKRNIDPYHPERGAHFLATNGDEERIISEAEVADYPVFKGTDYKEFSTFMERYLPQLILVEGDTSILPPEAPAEAQTNVTFELEFFTGTSEGTIDMEDAILEEAEVQGVELELIGSGAFSAEFEDSVQVLSVMRKALKTLLPQEDWDALEIVRLGPKERQRKAYPVVLKPKTKNPTK